MSVRFYKKKSTEFGGIPVKVGVSEHQSDG